MGQGILSLNIREEKRTPYCRFSPTVDGGGGEAPWGGPISLEKNRDLLSNTTQDYSEPAGVLVVFISCFLIEAVQ